MMSAYSEYFLSSDTTAILYELLEISHPSFSRLYRVVRNAVNGVIVTLETGYTASFIYYPVQITSSAARSDLDQVYKIEFGDMGDALATELSNIVDAGMLNIRPTLIYRAYRSDNLVYPLYGPITLEIASMDFTRTGATFEAKAPSLNNNATGELYTIDRFPMLRGFL